MRHFDARRASNFEAAFRHDVSKFEASPCSNFQAKCLSNFGAGHVPNSDAMSLSSFEARVYPNVDARQLSNFEATRGPSSEGRYTGYVRCLQQAIYTFIYIYINI